MESSKEFSGLQTQMIRCCDEVEFERLWTEYNKAVSREPFLPKKFTVDVDVPYSMTSELSLVFERNEEEISKKISAFSRIDVSDPRGAE